MEAPKNAEKSGWKLSVALTVGIVLVLFFDLLGTSSSGGPTDQQRTLGFIEALSAATESYITDNGPFPKNLDNRTFRADLSGAHLGRVYMEFKPRYVNDNGELLDAWGTPLRVWYISDKEIGITSAGPDKTFGTDDDITDQ